MKPVVILTIALMSWHSFATESNGPAMDSPKRLDVPSTSRAADGLETRGIMLLPGFAPTLKKAISPRQKETLDAQFSRYLRESGIEMKYPSAVLLERAFLVQQDGATSVKAQPYRVVVHAKPDEANAIECLVNMLTLMEYQLRAKH
jgi:hypothetical protein